MPEPTVRVTTWGSGACILELCDPPTKNALGEKMIRAFRQSLREQSHHQPKLLVLRGTGDALSAGLHLRDAASGTESQIRTVLTLIQELLLDLAAFPALTVADIGRLAVGSGADLALACDLRIAEPGACLSFPGFRAAGVLLGTQRLADLAPRLALDLMLTGRRVVAEEALAAGLLTHVLGTDEKERMLEQLDDGLAKVDVEQLRQALDLVRGPTSRRAARDLAASMNGRGLAAAFGALARRALGNERRSESTTVT